MTSRQILLLCLLLPLQGGCLCYVGPKVDYTLPVSGSAAADPVHVFRADVTRFSAMTVGGFLPSPDRRWKPEVLVESQRLTELSWNAQNETPSQVQASVSYAFFYPLMVVNAFTHTSQCMSLRLYRPGYKLVEVASWELGHRVTWEPAPDVKSQEETLDLLFRWPLDAGSTSPAHRDALLFGAAEYDRLAPLARSTCEQERLEMKAEELRKRAAE